MPNLKGFLWFLRYAEFKGFTPVLRYMRNLKGFLWFWQRCGIYRVSSGFDRDAEFIGFPPVLTEMMQSDRNRFCGDVVFDSFNMYTQWWRRTLRPEIWKANLLGSLLWSFQILRVIEKYEYFLFLNTAHNDKELIKLGFSPNVALVWKSKISRI